MIKTDFMWWGSFFVLFIGSILIIAGSSTDSVDSILLGLSGQIMAVWMLVSAIRK